MKFGIDIDGTLTRDTGMWFTILPHIVAHGHKLVTVTSRRNTLENQREIEDLMELTLGDKWPIVFAYDKPKKLAAVESGHHIDIWFDDQPHMIGTGSEDLRTIGVFENELRHAYSVLTDGSLKMGGFQELIERLETVLGE